MKASSAEFRLLAAFAAAVAVLGACAWLALASAATHLDASRHADRLADAAHDVAALRARYAESGAARAAREGSAGELRGDVARISATMEGDAAQRFAALSPLILAELEGTRPALVSLDPGSVDRQLRALDDSLVAQMRQARDAARLAGEHARDAGWLFALVVIMLLAAAYAVTMGGMRERRRLIGRLRQSVNHDPLTGLPNRRFFGEWLGYAIAHARREVRHVGLLFVDIEGVKAVDELHGKAAADALLIEIARRFRETAREGDVLARIGPDEFALAIPDVTDPHEATPLAQRLRDALTDPTLPPLADTPIGASVGVAFYPDDADDPAGVMAAADAAMVAAKGAGRNRVAFKPLHLAA